MEFDGYALLQEQADLLDDASPTEIGSTQFLRVKLAARQRSTALRNQYQRRGSQSESVSPSTTPSHRPRFTNADVSMNSYPYNSNQLAPLTNGNNSVRTSEVDFQRSGSMDDNSFAFKLQRAGEEGVSEGRRLKRRLYGGNSVSGSGDGEEDESSLNHSGVRRHVDPSLNSSFEDARGLKRNSFDDVLAVASGVRPAVPEVESIELVQCGHCGRSFAADRIKRHSVHCAATSKMDQEKYRRQKQMQKQQQFQRRDSELEREERASALL